LRKALKTKEIKLSINAKKTSILKPRRKARPKIVTGEALASNTPRAAFPNSHDVLVPAKAPKTRRKSCRRNVGFGISGFRIVRI